MKIADIDRPFVHSTRAQIEIVSPGVFRYPNMAKQRIEAKN